jgi:uncharacterized repeat protein (TIGR01451 family)
MRKNLLTIGMAWLLSGVAIFADVASGAEMVSLNGHVPSVVSRLTAKGSLPGTNQLNLAIGLPVRNPQDLSNLLEQVYDPASVNYHKYLTPDQFTARFGPTEQDYQSVIDFAQANGLVVTGTHPNRMLLDVQGKASDVERAFNVSLKVYRHPTENRDFYAPDVNPTVPQTLPIQDISGLDNYRRPYPNFRLKPKNVSANVSAKTTVVSQTNPSPEATTGSGPFGNYVGNDFRNAYVPGTSLNGSGQTIALVQFDGYLTSDINEYESLAGRTNIPLQNILIDGFTGVPTSNNGGGEVEVSLDIEMVISMAPALSKVILYEGNPFNFIPNDVLNRIATDNAARQVSSSWSWSGGPSATTDQIFQQMALQGQSYFNAVGDQDAYTSGANSANGVDNPDVPHTPGDSPYITEVGGTTLTMTGAGVSYLSETVWNWDVRYGPAADGEGTCGGISSYYKIPSWQTNINMAIPQGSTTFRNSPDVALTADDVLVIADGGVEYAGTGGTSCATPLWAGFTSLINQQGMNIGLPSVGFINPALYSIAAGKNYANCFHDITTGNNTWSGSPNLFYATPGYDLCTGLGTPNGTNLINALAASALTNAITHLSAPPPPYGTTLSVLKGTNPNGNWELFIQDDQPFNSGVISNGWWLTITMANPVGAAADEAVTMTPSTGSVDVDGYVDYSITVTNYGPMDSTNVIVTDTLPVNSTLVSYNATLGSIDRSGLNLIWNVGIPTVNSGGTPITVLTNTAGAQLTIEVQATNSVGNLYNLFNTATVTSDTPDPNPADNTASTNVVVLSSVAPEVTGVIGNNGVFQLSVNGTAGQQYIVEATTNLSTVPVVWVPLYTNTAPFTFPDPNTSDYTTRFYQAVPAP